MCALIFQTRISNMDSYINELTLHINQFICLIIKSNAQWVNKAKLHMLLHLPQSIRRFGPASLFSTEKFESYNGVSRKASIHSNRLSPSRDIAVTFANYSALKFLVSGGVMYNEQSGSTSTAASEVQQVFTGNPLLQRAMGYNYKVDENTSYPLDLNIKIPKEEKLPIPSQFDIPCDHPQIAQVAQLMVSKHNLLRQGVCLVVSNVLPLSLTAAPVHRSDCFPKFERGGKHLVGMIKSIWVNKSRGSTNYYVHVQGFATSNVDDHYQMRSIVRTHYDAVVHTKVCLGTF
ncbi:hypothetical protein PCASD_06291 [Puccinia coronata f. sp. avenae]|uniref:Uncharacterized protein n=1 Tax=Puccinia coronata f. sp. avenae TaxID=200324 RepID=A0A2N5V951_9BASI|nr:hypothetical protein PCASD_06291 [Puccinia coronata f. sp. avenae]